MTRAPASSSRVAVGLVAGAFQVALSVAGMIRHDGGAGSAWGAGLLFETVFVTLVGGYAGFRREQRAYE